MKVFSLSTAIFSAFLASSGRASGAAASIIEHGEKPKSHLRQNPLVNLNDLIATSDSDAADSSSTTAKWLFTDEEEAIELGQDATTGGTNWKLDGCCGRFETIFLSCFAAYLVVIKLLWNTFIMKPMKLVAVFVHGEFI